ncbi:hypothetical protein THIOM_005684 [Candidatus Thiomargarita nelsonii]|uniref:Uncharacterized protein n=1 Tax=Candidatus Thiomargarita nelsonii TaxID=1003181 RepID=A0A176RSH0_9GAMM|nr:hypothetical protein THIOM_005684 [Candidatus Thiomargarita nelsonii]
MSKVQELHEQAMILSDQAMVARHHGEKERAIALSYQAFEYESQAAALIPDEKASEPTRSILYCSAASLAYDAKELWEAQQLIVEGLSGYPSPRIKQALKSLYEKINAELQKKVRKLTFKSEYVQPLHC